MGLFQTPAQSQEIIDREAVRKAVLGAVAIFFDLGFSNKPMNVKRMWEEASGSVVGEMVRYRSIHRPAAAVPQNEDPADLTCNMP